MQVASKTKPMSLVQRVVRYIKDHPSIDVKSKEAQNSELYEAFEAETENEKKQIRNAKVAYYDSLDPLLNPPKVYSSKGSTSPKKKVLKNISEVQANLRPWKEVVKCPHCPGAYVNEVMKFVGFRGHIDKDGICHLDIKGEEHPGEAWPPPVVPVRDVNRDNLMRLTGFTREQLGSRFYLGILRYEVELMGLIFLLRGMGYENIALLMARGMGKTYIFVWDDQMGLKHFNRNIMMLSETNARKKVGNWVYVWALRNKYLKDPEKFARKSTYQHFELLNEARMDIYKYSDEDLVGEHDYILKLDDCVKRKWRERPTENQKMIDHFQSNINFIIRSGLELAGTCKFEGDLIAHIIGNIEDMIVIKQSPFIECEHGNLNDDGTYDSCEICQDLCLLAPEIHSHKDLMKKKNEDLEAWWAEMMQNPHPMEGGVWESVGTQFALETPYVRHYDLFFIYIDRATTMNKTSDLTGCIMGVREMKTNRRIITNDYTDHTSFADLILLINERVTEIHDKYEHMGIVLIIEKQGGGDDFYTMIMTQNYFEAGDKLVRNNIREYAGIVMIHSTGSKTNRIKDRLYAPITNRRIIFLDSLLKSLLVESILRYPRCKYFDAIDALAIGDFEIAQMPQLNLLEYTRNLNKKYEDFREGRLDELEHHAEPDVPNHLKKELDRLGMHTDKRVVF
jgi:hypothetical protein